MEYPGEKVFFISSCYAANQELSKEIRKNYSKSGDFKPPKYLFIPCEETIYWEDAFVGWTILFHQLPDVKVDEQQHVKRLLDSIHQLGVGKFRYFRWDEDDEKYRTYEPSP
jgi:hypothetical protein